MDILHRKLLIEQLDKKFVNLSVLKNNEPPQRGWIFTIRTALHMSLAQLAKRLKTTVSSVNGFEQRELEKSISLNKLMEVAEALDCHFVYGFIPKTGSLETVIEERALSLAKEIVARTSHTMQLEGQGSSNERQRKAIKARADLIKNEIPKYLWD